MSLQIPVQVGGQTLRLDPRFNLRFLFPEVVRHALIGLQRDRWEPWYKTYLEQQGISEQQLVHTWQCFANYAQACLQGLDSSYAGHKQSTPLDALENSGFLGCPAACRLVVLAKVGQLVTATFWHTARDGTLSGMLPEDIAQLKNMGDLLARQLLG